MFQNNDKNNVSICYSIIFLSLVNFNFHALTMQASQNKISINNNNNKNNNNR